MLELTTTSDAGVTIEVDGAPLALSWTWLRDHSLDEESFLASAQQRIATPDDIATAGRGAANVHDGALHVSWPNGPSTRFDVAFLGSLRDPMTAVRTGADAEAWTATTIGERALRQPFAGYIGSDDGLRTALEHLWRDGVVTITDVPIDKAATRSVLERIGYVRSTIFGDLWEFSSDGGFDDTASTPLEITPHTDGTYSHDAPGLLGLHCHVYLAEGGENVFVDGHALVERLTDEARTILTDVEIPARYIGDGAHLMACRPALRFVQGQLGQISYNHHDRAPFLLPEPAMTDVLAALRELDGLANDPSLQYEVAMRPGDMVLFDNWRVLHGRRAFRGERLIAGGYINREDVESRSRQLAVR
ncbi:MAG: TauD/TfdA family dioxygenase [Ilumatobacter sp.]